MNDMLNPRWWIQRAFRAFAVILCVLFIWELAVRTPFGAFLLLALALYAAYRIFASGPERARRPQRNTGGAERTPVLPGGHRP